MVPSDPRAALPCECIDGVSLCYYPDCVPDPPRFRFEFFLMLSEAPPYEVAIPVAPSGVDREALATNPDEVSRLPRRKFRRTKVRDYSDTGGRYVYVEA